MFRKILLATASAAALSTGALAADMPTKAAPMYSPVPVMNWSGFYIGANVGYGSAKITPNIATGTGSATLGGAFGGGQIGYNWQGAGSPLVLGIEGDFQGSAQDRTDTVLGIAVTQETPWFGTLRGRIGYAPGAWMIYFTGGGAWARYEVSALGITGSKTVSGWTAGGGVEWMFAPRWSAKVEYLHMDFGTETVAFAGVPFTGKAKNDLGRFGVNYHF